MSSQNPVQSSPQMSGDSPRSVLLALRAQPLFANLAEDEFHDVVTLLHSQAVQQGDLIVELGGLNTDYYILRRGRVELRRLDNRGRDFVAGSLGKGDAFNEKPFLTGMHSEESIEALEDGKLWTISRGEFQNLLDKRPAMRSKLVYSEEVTEILRRMRRRDWLRPDEVVLLLRRKHFLVFLAVFVPAFLLYVVGLILAYILLLPYFPAIALIATGFMAVFTLWTLVNWFNDYYAVTDQRVVHRERTLLLQDRQDEISLNRIQDVTVQRSFFIEMLFNIGDVIIQAAGTGSSVKFTALHSPDDVTRIIFEQRARALTQKRVSERARIRSELRREIDLGPSSKAAAMPRPPERPSFGQRFRQALGAASRAPAMLAPRTRVVQGNNVIYRKHWLVLVRTAWLPALCLVLYIAVLVFMTTGSAELQQLFMSTCAGALVALIGLGLAFWLVWRYEDWRNDIYILTRDRLVDIDRSPFGVLGTQRREAGLSAIQNVTSSTHGLVDNLLNVGDVVIKTAGAAGELTFMRVQNPRLIQREIVNRVEAFESSQRDRDAEARRHELKEWIGIYDELTRVHERSS